jgi:hypothetical protein
LHLLHHILQLKLLQRQEARKQAGTNTHKQTRARQ